MFRVIPKLDIKGDSLVKRVNLEGLRVLGRPELFAKYYDEVLMKLSIRIWLQACMVKILYLK